MNLQIYDVSQINQYLRLKFEADPLLGSVAVRGEISNYKVYPSGHHYFTLKDAEASLRCVMFRGNAMGLRFRPENGMKIIAAGRISVFPRDGGYQLYCSSLTADGAGDLHVAFQQLRSRLEAEGLFDPAHKKPLPVYPHRIAIVTSSAGAAIHDMLRILNRRYPLSTVLLLPVRVQGVEAPAEIADAIAFANRHRLADVMIVGRGGGSIEDLWAFNDEKVARAIYASQIPVVSAVGHEPDVTIADYVADVRAATPSNGAELVAPDQSKLLARLQQLGSLLNTYAERRVKLSRRSLEALSGRKCLQDPSGLIDGRRMMLDYTQQKLTAAARQKLSAQRQRFVHLTAKLDAMSPLKVIARGYSLTENAAGQVISSCGDTEVGDTITVRLADGRVKADVIAVQEDSHE